MAERQAVDLKTMDRNHQPVPTVYPPSAGPWVVRKLGLGFYARVQTVWGGEEQAAKDHADDLNRRFYPATLYWAQRAPPK